jgi:hypothetical protein
MIIVNSISLYILRSTKSFFFAYVALTNRPRRLSVTFYNMAVLCWKLLTLSSTHQNVEDCPLSAVLSFLFDIFLTDFYTCTRSVRYVNWKTWILSKFFIYYVWWLELYNRGFESRSKHLCMPCLFCAPIILYQEGPCGLPVLLSMWQPNVWHFHRFGN